MLTNDELAVALKNRPGERVTEEYMRSRIDSVEFTTLPETTTICQITLDNGYSTLGKSACVDPTNFDAEIGRKIAHDDAFNQLWPLFGFLLSEARYQRKGSGDED